MGFFRRESLHERLAREGGLLDDQRARPAWDEVGIHGVPRPRQWDFLVTAEAPDLLGERVEFVGLPDRTLLVEEGEEEGLDPLAAAVEQRAQPPYRAMGARQVGDLWAVSGRQIQVAEFEAEGNRIELTRTGDGRRLVVDEVPAFGSVPELERLGDAVGESYAIHAQRLDADLWEVRVSAL